jgi:hypothetical protein
MLGNKGLKKELNKLSALVLDILSFGVPRPCIVPTAFATLIKCKYSTYMYTNNAFVFVLNCTVLVYDDQT